MGPLLDEVYRELSQTTDHTFSTIDNFKRRHWKNILNINK